MNPLGALVLFSGLLLLIMLQGANSKLAKILNNLRVIRELLEKNAESRGAQAAPTLPKKEPDVYRL